MNRFNLGFWAISLLSIMLIGCSSSHITSPGLNTHQISLTNLESNLEFLANNLLEGREATTRGEKIAGLFISSELKKYGVQPYYEEYYQKFNLNSTSFEPESFFEYDNNKFSQAFVVEQDFLIIKSAQIEDSFKVIFAGYGITAEEFKHDDYAGIDVKDKFILILPGEPYSTVDTFFNGEAETRHALMYAKIRNATRHGVKGVLFLDNDETGKNWSLGKQWFSKPDMTLKLPEENNQSLTVLYLSINSSKSILKDEAYSYDSTINISKGVSSLPAFELGGTMIITINKKIELKESFNIIGVIPGNDDKLNDEYVAIGAHFDHLGISEGKVFNGADDDGSGVVAVLEVANAFAKSRENRRSILVVFHSAEEKGLYGSEYLSENLEIMNNIVAQINLDMVGRESVDSIYSVGSDKINPLFKKIVEEANLESANFVFNYKFDDPDDPEKIYSRSDHYNYAKLGIPIVFFYDNMKEDYHKDSDEISKINFQKIKKTAELVYLRALKTANMDTDLRTTK